MVYRWDPSLNAFAEKVWSRRQLPLSDTGAEAQFTAAPRMLGRQEQ